MQEKKGYTGAVVKGILLGSFVIYMLVFSHVGGGDFVAILFWLLSCAIGIGIFVIPVYQKNQIIESEQQYELRRIEERKQQEKKHEIEEEKRRVQQAKEREISLEIMSLKREFDEGANVADLIKQSRNKALLVEELKKKVDEYERLYFSILAYPETTLEREIFNKILDPKTALARISGHLWNNTIFWEEKNAEWKEHNLYASKLTYSYNGVSKVLIKDEYGVANEEYISKLRNYDLLEYNKYFDDWNKERNSEEKLNFDYIFEAMWKYAFSKPCDVGRFRQAVDIINDYLYTLSGSDSEKIECLDVVLAELYVAKEFGEKVIGEKQKIMDKWVNYHIDLFSQIGKTLKTSEYGAGSCVELASGLKWMGLYDLEAEVLRKIVTAGLSLSDELQERLLFIENIGSDLKKVYDISSSEKMLALDYATLNWREEDYNKLFQTLVFENKGLQYSLTIREWTQNIVMEGNSGLKLDKAYEKVKQVVVDEYLDSVKAKTTEFTLLSEDGTGTVKIGLLIQPEKQQVGFDYVALLLNVIGFGRNINLRIYTLFMPVEVSVEKQKQQTISLKNNMNPDVIAFESGVQSSILKGMQQYMNGDASEGESDMDRTLQNEQNRNAVEEQLF